MTRWYMKNFDFLKTLKPTLNEGMEGKKKLTDGISYSEYDVDMLSGATKTVFIPNRNTDMFEDAINNTDILTETSIREIMRKCNGVTEI